MKKPSVIGCLATIIWLIGLLIYVSHFMGWPKFSAMSPNEFGDFLAGAAAPLAFFWLVIGFFQQGQELKLQREELELQRKELELQRKETERLADEAVKQATSIAANELHARKDTFFRFAEIVHSKQQSIGSTLYEEIIRTGSGAGWERISNGDNDFFFRSIVQHVFPGRTEETANNILRNKHADSGTKNFIDNFRNLIMEAERCDEENILIGQYENGWMGTLYAGLCLITNNRTEFRVRKQPAGPEDIF